MANDDFYEDCEEGDNEYVQGKLGHGKSAPGKLSLRQFCLANCWFRDAKNDIPKCSMHKYTNTQIQHINIGSIYPIITLYIVHCTLY